MKKRRLLTWCEHGCGVLQAGKLRCPATARMEVMLGAGYILSCHVPANLRCLWGGKALGCIYWSESLNRPRGGGLQQSVCASPSRRLNRLHTRPFVRMLRHVAASCVGRLVMSCCSSLRGGAAHWRCLEPVQAAAALGAFWL